MSVGIGRRHHGKRIIRFQCLVNLLPRVLCAIGCPAGIIAVRYAGRKEAFIFRKALIPNTQDSGSSILIAKKRIGIVNSRVYDADYNTSALIAQGR